MYAFAHRILQEGKRRWRKGLFPLAFPGLFVCFTSKCLSDANFPLFVPLSVTIFLHSLPHDVSILSTFGFPTCSIVYTLALRTDAMCSQARCIVLTDVFLSYWRLRPLLWHNPFPDIVITRSMIFFLKKVRCTIMCAKNLHLIHACICHIAR